VPIRDLLVTAIVFVLVPLVFKHAWIGALLWSWLSIMNPHRLAWGFAYSMPFAAIAAGATLIALFTTKDRVQLPREGAVYLVIAFIAWMCITTLAAFDPAGSWTQLWKVLKIQLMVLVTLAVIHEPKHIRWFVWVNAMSLGFFGLKGGIYTIQTAGGGRVWGPGGFIGGNNEIGLAMLLAVPLLFYLYLTTTRRWVRWGLMLTMLLSAVAILGTQSRGGFLAIIAMGAVLWWRAPVNRFKSGISVALIGAGLLVFMPQTWHDRMATIVEYEQDGSAMGRIYAWQTAINIANHRPTGAGFDMYVPRVASTYGPKVSRETVVRPDVARAAHSIYFQVLGEHGWIGLALFLAIWIKAWRDASAVRRMAHADPSLRWAYTLAGMCQVSLVGYAAGGAFLSLAYFDLPYNILIMIVATKCFLMQRLAPAAVEAAPMRPTLQRGTAPR
jgi:putative inorganic carbon (HCO3(-)) transporter